VSVARIVAVAPGSPAERAGIAPGDELLALNGEAIRDVIRYQLQADEELVELDLRRGGLESTITIAKPAGAGLGLELDSAVFDRVRTCDNHCPFCFIHQLPPGMRKSLSLKDDDFRLSFLYGNFTTLTRFTEADLERVVTERLSPLYVSIHATDPDVRTRLLRNRRGAVSLRWLRAMLDEGIEVHGQVVVCPGINDGAVLDDTLLGIFDRFSEIATVGVVPLGVSAHNREPEMRPHTTAEAEAVVDIVAQWQSRFAAALHRRAVYASDEYYLLAGRPFPALSEYEGCPQHENGIGMAAALAAELIAAIAGEGPTIEGHAPRAGFFAWVDGARPDGYRVNQPVSITSRPPDGATHSRAKQPIRILTGEMGAAVLDPHLRLLAEHAGVGVETMPIRNDFFGGNIGVTGLLTGADLSRELAHAPVDCRYLLPDVTLSRGRFLDNTAVEDLPRVVEVVATSGAGLAAALAEVRS
jgi:putative radical SAM enzyme (TIGR03279 family)